MFFHTLVLLQIFNNKSETHKFILCYCNDLLKMGRYKAVVLYVFITANQNKSQRVYSILWFIKSYHKHIKHKQSYILLFLYRASLLIWNIIRCYKIARKAKSHLVNKNKWPHHWHFLIEKETKLLVLQTITKHKG